MPSNVQIGPLVVPVALLFMFAGLTAASFVGSRAFFAADTAVWIRSGLATLQPGEAGAGTPSPAYRQATAVYVTTRSGTKFNAAVERLERAQQVRSVKAAQRWAFQECLSCFLSNGSLDSGRTDHAY